jgi:hypothetical protein
MKVITSLFNRDLKSVRSSTLALHGFLADGGDLNPEFGKADGIVVAGIKCDVGNKQHDT